MDRKFDASSQEGKATASKPMQTPYTINKTEADSQIIVSLSYKNSR